LRDLKLLPAIAMDFLHRQRQNYPQGHDAQFDLLLAAIWELVSEIGGLEFVNEDSDCLVDSDPDWNSAVATIAVLRSRDFEDAVYFRHPRTGCVESWTS